MDIILEDTLTKEKRLFAPITPGRLSFYYCGPTVYWTQHIGVLRGGTMADLVVRTFLYNGYDVKFVRNYTDVGHLVSDEDDGEDKMEKAAKRENRSPEEIAKFYTEKFERDTRAINLIEPTIKPRATDHVPEMIEIIGELLKKEFAYETDLAIYFDVTRAVNYNRLSGQDLSKNKSGAGTGEITDPNKRHSFDFAIWFFAAGTHKNALQTWPSPFHSSLTNDGRGFPGWHIECSAMSKKYLGATIDLHMGGIEHIPVHHTNEIAQSESANGIKFVNYWLHNEHLLVDNKKMAKSAGTSYSLDDVKAAGHNPLALRYLFLQAHYRSQQNFTWEALDQAEAAYKKLTNYAQENGDVGIGAILEDYEHSFHEAINDDFNIPKGLAVMWNMIRDSKQKPADILATLFQFDKVFGLGLAETAATPIKTREIPEEITEMLAERDVARADKNWKLSDEIRKKIEAAGYKIEDTDKGSRITS